MVFILSLQGGDILFIPSHSAKRCKLGLGVSRNVVVLLVLCWMGVLCELILLSLKKFETDIKMLNCIPCYENTKGQAEGSGFSEHTTDTIAKMHQRTNELFQGIISQILGIKYQDTFI